jgi:CRP-like cAMP-binding protein
MFAAAITDCKACPLGAAFMNRCIFTPASLPAASALATWGERPGRLYFVREGLALLSSAPVPGQEATLAVRGPGALLCPESMHGRPSPTDVRALTELRVCAVAAPVLSRWLGPDGSPVRVVVDLLVGELAQRQQDLSLREGDSLSRVARFLLGAGSPLALGPLRKQLVARILGMRPETLSRCLRRLVDEGMLESGPDARVRDVAALAAVAGVEPPPAT